MAGLPRRLRRLASRFGIPKEITDREEVIRLLEIDSEKAAEEVRLALERFLKQLSDSSIGNPFAGYTAVKEKLGSQKVVLPRSKVNISGDYQWSVYVQSPDNDFNLFDLLDAGRDELLERSPSQGPYPLWNVVPGSGTTEYANRQYRTGYAGQGRLVNSDLVGSRDTGGRFTISPRSETSKYARGVRDSPAVFSFGPIRGFAALLLYERAKDAAKDRLAGTGFDEWDVIHVGGRS